jgi:hypothetical protein
MKIALSITVEKKSDGTFDVVSPSLLNGKPTTCNFCSTEDIGEHVGDLIYGVFDVPALWYGIVPTGYERLARRRRGSTSAVCLLKTAKRREKE